MDNQDILEHINRNLYKISKSLESIDKKMEDSTVRESLNNIEVNIRKQLNKIEYYHTYKEMVI